jgi:hypothetical protein
LPIGPGKSCPRSSNLSKTQVSNAVIEGIHQRPIDVGVVLVLCTTDQIEVPNYHHRELGAVDFGFLLQEKLSGQRMVCRPIDTNNFKLELGFSVED